MKTFKQFITENTLLSIDDALKMCKSFITEAPYYFNWQVKEIRGVKIIIGTRKAEDCVDKREGDQFIARLERRVATERGYWLTMTYPTCHLFTYQNVLDFGKIERVINGDTEKGPDKFPFGISYGTVDIKLPMQDEDIRLINQLYTVYNLYVITRGTKVEKINKIIEYIKKNGYAGTKWTDEDEITYNQFKVKYLPNDLTDDDHALNAMYNL